MRARDISRRLAAALIGLAAAVAMPAARAQALASSPAAAPAFEQIGGTFADGTRWVARKPANWNGTLLLDLDGAGMGPATTTPSGFNAWVLSQGYGLGGVTREPVGYDFPKAVDYLLDVRGRFSANWGAPKRTLALGVSRGAFVVRKAMELHPDVFDGGLLSAGGGAGEIAVLNNKLNALFVLKTLVDPTAPLKLVNIDTASESAAVTALLAKAKASPQGRARLALAAAVIQFAPWSAAGQPKPAASDYDAQLDQIAASFAFGVATPVRAGVEKIAGGNVSWNVGADYSALLKRSGRQAMVEALYAKAGLSLADDLAVLAKAPRISADPAAVRRAEPLMTYSGKIKGPIVDVDNDDPVDPASDKLAYVATLKRAGTDGKFRQIWTDSAGHAGMSNLDRAVGFSLLIQQLDTGQWGDSSVVALKTRGAEIARGSSVELGRLTVFDPGPLPKPANTWDVSNWGTYKVR